jgi:RNA polymerase sigma factor FliA
MLQLDDPVETDHARLEQERARGVNALFDQHLGPCQKQARAMARSFRSGLLDPDDCAQSASIALLESARRYDDSRGVPFKHFVRPRVRGAVLDLLRAELRARMHRFPNANDRINQRLDCRIKCADGQDADFESFIDLIGEVALGLMLDEVSLLNPTDPDGDHLLYSVFGQQVHHYIRQLPERQRELITLHYFQQCTFAEIAQTWQLSKGRISQLHSAALAGLRERMR